MSKLHRKVARDCTFLAVDELPKEQSGVKIEKLDYEGDVSDEEIKLSDNDVKQLTDGLKNSTHFKGPLNLSQNKLTDLVSYIFNL